MYRPRFLIYSGLSLLLILGINLAGFSNVWSYNDHDLARQLVLDGKIQSLENILDKAKAKQAGRLLEIELEKVNGKWTYEVVFLNDKGEIVELYFDAKSADFLYTYKKTAKE